MPQRESLFEATITETVRLRHLVYLPPRYHERPHLRWPLMLFLHGAGERGNDLSQVCKHGPPKLAEERALPFVILSPQCPAETTWLGLLRALAALLEDALQRYRVDPDRVYVTGLSMGGFGTWALAADRPDLVAAIAPICGGGDWFRGFPARVLNLWEMPVWAFHGARDQVVPPSGSQELVALLQALGGPARLTLYPHADHDSWTETYNNPALYRWLLMQRLKPHRRPRTLETALPDGSTLRYWQGGGGCIIAPESAGLGRLVPLEAKTWQALAAERSDPRRLAQELAALGLPSELAPYVTAVQAAAE